MSKKNEEWKLIPGSDNVMVSNMGRLKKEDKILEPKDDKQGYLRISVGNKIRDRVHRFVAKAFVPNPYGKDQVNHINGNKTDNRASNLEWVTSKENTVLAVKQGLISKKTGKKRKILAISKDHSKIMSFDSQKDAEKKTGYSNKDINKCLTGQRETSHGYYWKYLDEVNMQLDGGI